ncbi:MAG: tRNA (adenosine(37)-N6)-threonylcarbamoyltransferase complex ATPase subunit type 1 TsaE [Actinobacteria bacterium ATB1]|nr:tRNA (adenosine(37)-N6)-threonylcarbamoyltransferase complex ATPase subunit type 1 TsaE [Actinobacteria bacterium ATB1]
MSSNSDSSDRIRALSNSPSNTRALGRALASVLGPGDVVLLDGDLGTGKTTFVSGVAAGVGVEQPVTSPTFTIVRDLGGSPRVLHVDLYRLDHMSEFEDLGLDEALGRDIVLVEWGEVVRPLLGESVCEVLVSYTETEEASSDQRSVEFRLSGPAWSARKDRLRRAVATAGGSGPVMGAGAEAD